uniref:sensor histidine kinase n=1 Tax=Prevotella sp. TaxID=59823 RepID=UPI00402A204B
MGIPKDDLPHLFEPFYRASNTGSVIGHGVGLALIKAILEKHGAKVSVESQLGEGTTVRVPFR